MIERVKGDVIIRAPGPLRGVVRPPGSKSLTNRALLIAALADEPTTLNRASLADDAWAMIDALRALGVPVDVASSGGVLSVHSARGFIPAAAAELDIGHAGTTMRFLTALCTLGQGRYRIDGSPRMRQRPIGPLVEALRELGAAVHCEYDNGCPPVLVASQGLPGGELVFRDPPSSQYVSAVLMVAPYARRDVKVAIEGAMPSRPFVEMTIRQMRDAGVEVLAADDARRFVVPATQRYRGGATDIEPDASAASYWWAAAALTGGEITVAGLTRDAIQGDVHFVDVLAQMGCRVTASDAGLTVAAPTDGVLRGIDVDLNHMPDTVQTLAVAAAFADTPTTIRNVANLRIKETDRISALTAELAKIGARVEPRADGLTIQPAAAPIAATIDTYDDHRMAMSFALAGLRIDGVRIRDAGCVSKSYPAFFDVLDNLARGY